VVGCEVRNEPYEVFGVGAVPLNEDVWAGVRMGYARRVYVFPDPTGRVLPNTLGLEPVVMDAYRCDADGGLNQPDDYLRIATELAREEGWIAYAWRPEYAEVFMQAADVIVWLDDGRMRLVREAASRQVVEDDPLRMLVLAVRRGVRWWRGRRSGRSEGEESATGLLELALESKPDDLITVLVQMSLSAFPEKLLRVSHGGQVTLLNGVRPTR
jgi:hypothetical protein